MTKSKTKQWLWFIGLWCLGLLAVGMISLVIKGIFALGQ
jgi:hypothetical protein